MADLLDVFGYTHYFDYVGGRWWVITPFYTYRPTIVPDVYGDTVL